MCLCELDTTERDHGLSVLLFYDVHINSGTTLNFSSACVFVNAVQTNCYSAEASSLALLAM